MKKLVTFLIITSSVFMTKTFAQGGSATPNELFAIAAKAMETKDYAAFGKLFVLSKGEKPEEIDAMVGIIKLYPRIIEFKNSGIKKFGEAFKYEIISGTCSSDLDFGVNWKFDFEAAKNATFKQQKMFDEIWANSTTPIECEGFERPVSNSIYALQKDGRWYMLLAKNRVKLLKALQKFVPEAQKSLEQSTSASELAKKISSLRSYFDDFYN